MISKSRINCHGRTTASFRPDVTTFGLSTLKRPTFLIA
jgi:hypothetical protein